MGSSARTFTYRLRVTEIEIPPLDERLDDIPMLVSTFLKKMGRDREHLFHLAAGALRADELLLAGNVRELENALNPRGAQPHGVIVPETSRQGAH